MLLYLKFQIQRDTVIVVDTGLNTSDNIYFLAGENHNSNLDSYISGQSVRRADEEFNNRF